MSGKGSAPRKQADYEAFRRNWEQVFGVKKEPEDEHKYDLFWHALNYRTAVDARDCWDELRACVNRLIERGGKV